MASPADVSSVLAALGGPEALVGLEHARLAAAGSGPRRGGPEPGAATDPMAAAGGSRRRGTRSGAKAADADSDADTGGKAATGSGRLLRLPRRPRLLGRQRAGSPAAADEPGTRPGAEWEPADEDQAILRRPVTARRRPGAILPDKSKAAMRLRGPQGRDSPVLQPVKRNRSAWQEQAARGGLRAAGEPDDAGQPGHALTFVPKPTPGSRRMPTGRAKFYPVRDPAGWPASPGERKPPPGRGPAVPPARTAEPGSGRPAGSAGNHASGPEPVFHRDGHAPGSDPAFGPPRQTGQGTAPGPRLAAGPESARAPEQAAGAGPAPGQGQAPGPAPDYQPGQKYRPEGKDQPEQVYRPRQKYRPASPGQQSALHSKPALRSWPGQEPDPADEPGGPVAATADPAPGRGERILSALRAALRWAFRLARRRPLEATAVVLMGLGGLIYPPVWLAGALVALSSRLWDGRDKWFGVVVPAIVTIVGSVGLAMGGTHQSAGSYVHAVLTIGGYLLRAGAVIGASYLAWRASRGQRAPAQPPWRRGHH